MANMFMKVFGLQPHGSTGRHTGGANIDEGVGRGWITLRSLSWEADRSVSMDIGNGMNRDSGMTSMSEITLTKELDGASEYILSRLYVPGNDGDTINIIVTKPDRAGKGGVIYLQIQLENARITNYSVSAVDGLIPLESLAMAYSSIGIRYWSEDEGGKLDQGGRVHYDLPTGRPTEHAAAGR